MKKYNTYLSEIIYIPFVNQMINEIDSFKENEIEVSWNCLGGSIWAGNQFADFLQTVDKKINARVTGVAASMGTILLAYFNKVTGAKQADVMIHSALSNVTELTKRANEALYNTLKSKINESKFKEITGYELKDIMFKEGINRIDVWVSGQDAYDFGLFDELIDLTPEEKIKKELKLNELKLSAGLDYILPEKFKIKEVKKVSMKSLEELKAAHPELYNEAVEFGKSDGLKSGIKIEKDRVNAWMVFNDVDPEKVKTGIESGIEMTKAEELGFLRKSQMAEMQKSLEDLNVEGVNPNKKVTKLKTEEEKEVQKLDNALDNFGIKEKEDK